MPHRRWLGDLSSILTVCSCVLLSASLNARSAVPWTDAEIGAPKASGSSSEFSGSWTVTGTGSGISGAADQFHFLYDEASGDVDLQVQVGSLRGDAGMQAGLTLRQSRIADAAQASLVYSPLTGLSFLVRTAAGEEVVAVAGTGSDSRVFLRLVRTGTVVSALYSADGSAWTVLKRVTLALPADVVAGIGVSNDTSSTLGTATFAGLSLSATPWPNRGPTVSITAPAAGAAFDLPATLTLAATAGDNDGVVRRVDFYVDGVAVGRATSAPYKLGWVAPGDGTYRLHAVATDDGGATTASATVDFTVRDSVSLPSGSTTSAQFYPSSDHDTLVDFYRIEIRISEDGLSRTPVEAMNLGKPAVKDGVITVDVTTLFNALPSGDYYAVVKAVGEGGAGTSGRLPFAW